MDLDTTFCSSLDESNAHKISNNNKSDANDCDESKNSNNILNNLKEMQEAKKLHFNGTKLLGIVQVCNYIEEIAKMNLNSENLNLAQCIRKDLLKIYQSLREFELIFTQSNSGLSISTQLLSSGNLMEVEDNCLNLNVEKNTPEKHSEDPLLNCSFSANMVNKCREIGLDQLVLNDPVLYDNSESMSSTSFPIKYLTNQNFVSESYVANSQSTNIEYVKTHAENEDNTNRSHLNEQNIIGETFPSKVLSNQNFSSESADFIAESQTIGGYTPDIDQNFQNFVSDDIFSQQEMQCCPEATQTVIHYPTQNFYINSTTDDKNRKSSHENFITIIETHNHNVPEQKIDVQEVEDLSNLTITDQAYFKNVNMFISNFKGIKKPENYDKDPRLQSEIRSNLSKFCIEIQKTWRTSINNLCIGLLKNEKPWHDLQNELDAKGKLMQEANTIVLDIAQLFNLSLENEINYCEPYKIPLRLLSDERDENPMEFLAQQKFHYEKHMPEKIDENELQRLKLVNKEKHKKIIMDIKDLLKLEPGYILEGNNDTIAMVDWKEFIQI